MKLSHIKTLVSCYKYHYDAGNKYMLEVYEEKILEEFPSVNEFMIKYGSLK